MNRSTLRLAIQWIVGGLLGTTLIGISSPLFVRSYVPLQHDPVRGVYTLQPDSVYRWRSEGYADTRIGPLGMPGKVAVRAPRGGELRIALWGDSQAEGVCVPDEQKIFAQAEQVAQSREDDLQVFPLARSGEDAAAWLTQLRAVEQALAVDVHVFLIVDLPDLLSATSVPPPAVDASIAVKRKALAARLPAFVVQAARNLLTEVDGVTPRRLRFSIGPVPGAPGGSELDSTSRQPWRPALDAIAAATERPVIILYAPIVPQIVQGKLITSDPQGDDFEAVRYAAEQAGVRIVDLRERFRSSMQHDRWPHGFHNGQIGSGHLNSVGNAIVAEALSDATSDVVGGSKRFGAWPTSETSPVTEEP